MTLRLIEAKDFRVIGSPPDRSKIAGLAQTVAGKVANIGQRYPPKRNMQNAPSMPIRWWPASQGRLRERLGRCHEDFYRGLDLPPVSICTNSAALSAGAAIGLGGVSQRPGIRAR